MNAIFLNIFLTLIMSYYIAFFQYDTLGTRQRLSDLVQTSILKFFEHVSWRVTDSIERLVVQGRVEGTRMRRSLMR